MSLSELDGPADSDGLTEPQRRHVSVFLQQVEEALDEIERVAYEAPSDEKLFRTDIADLPDGFGAAFEPEASRIRAQLKDLAEELGLESHPRSRARHVQALLLMTMVQVEDTGSRGLRGYGPLGPSVDSVVDPALAEVHAGLLRIAAWLEAAHHSHAPASRDGR
jgi:hypothetical protein